MTDRLSDRRAYDIAGARALYVSRIEALESALGYAISAMAAHGLYLAADRAKAVLEGK